MKDGKKQEIEEEVPLEEIKEIEPEKEPETTILLYITTLIQIQVLIIHQLTKKEI